MVAVGYAGVSSSFVLRKLNLATGYVALAFLAATLLVGPHNLWRGRPNPLSQDVRRDLGIWTAMLAIAHTVVGLQVHMQGRWLEYFLWPTGRPHSLPIRTDGFGFANYTGLASTLVLVMLLAISNDVALRTLGSARWKALQRWSYGAAAFMVAHSVAFQVMEKRALWVVAGFAVVVLATAAGQLMGFRKARAGAGSGHRAPPPPPASLPG
jgi:sulfoxide reductase heme-binding subunit YedZ